MTGLPYRLIAWWRRNPPLPSLEFTYTARGAAGALLYHAHGAPTGVDPQVWLGDDPDLALVGGDLDAWLESQDQVDDDEVEAE